ncbi:MAG: transcription termination/antitermination protein NusA [Candidatus Nealsonbacteria bacterium]|nr:transcription termination/antitermination protein NusA [Candidatus Nealsonbacteria bacterium]
MDLKSFTSAVSQIAEEKGLPPEKVIDGIEHALAAAYKKDYGEKGQLIRAKMNPETGEVEFWQVKLVVTEDMLYSPEEGEEESEEEVEEEEEMEGEDGDKKIRFNPQRHIMLEEAKKINSVLEGGEELLLPLEPKADFGRIAAQTAKQVIMQRVREAEKEAVFDEYREKEDQIISGIVQRVGRGGNILLNIGKTIGILPKEEQVPGEFYKPGQRLKVYVMKVEETPKGPKIYLSRSYPKLVSRLFELEVPEIAAGSVEIRSIAREAGSRTKIAVLSNQENIDPIGAAVGQRGTRVQVVINELGGEKIDIIEYSEEPQEYVSNSLSPAKVLEVKILPKNKALAIVPDDQLSLAIGKDGQNVRLAAKLTGWKIDVRSDKDYDQDEDLTEEEDAEEKAPEKEGPGETEEKETEENEEEEK